MNISKHQVERYFYGDPKQIADKILFVKRNTRLGEYKEHLTDVHEFGNVWQGITGLLRGESVTIIVAGVGPGLIGDAAYALNKPDTICLYSGTCGGLDKDIEIGDCFIAEHAVCGDGYTLQFGYPPFAEVSGDCELAASLKSSQREKIKSGISFTTNSVVREVDDDFWERVPEKCHIIEMASASFYAAANATGKRAIAYFWVTDLPTRGKSFFDALSVQDVEIKQNRFERSVTLDLELLSAL